MWYWLYFPIASLLLKWGFRFFTVSVSSPVSLGKSLLYCQIGFPLFQAILLHYPQNIFFEGLVCEWDPSWVSGGGTKLRKSLSLGHFRDKLAYLCRKRTERKGQQYLCPLLSWSRFFSSELHHFGSRSFRKAEGYVSADSCCCLAPIGSLQIKKHLCRLVLYPLS